MAGVEGGGGEWGGGVVIKTKQVYSRKVYILMYININWHSSGAVWESRWPSWDVRPNEPSGFRGRKAILNHASALVSTCP